MVNQLSAASSKPPKKQYYRKRVELFRLLEKIKLWPSRTGALHGVKTLELKGEMVIITTHCGESFTVPNSRNGRAARWLRNKWFHEVCRGCQVPQWKLEKYNATRFNRKYGSNLGGQ
ncbi:MAG: hypothetical protein HQK55_15645 [Deltaproteobacteria bacterium]|nr:hypothetical protein [Deltaproteobacteria bacterium]